MKDFEKALEESANEKEQNLFKMMIKEGYDIPIAEQQAEYCNLDFQSGARWARDFTVREIIDVLKSIRSITLPSCKIMRFENTTAIKIIESHFKDRGVE